MRGLLARCLPVLVLAGLLPAAALPTPAAAGGGPFAGLTVSATAVGPGTAVTVQSTTLFDVGPTPWWTQIYDLTTGTRVAICGSGTTCTATVSHSTPYFGRYQAFLGAVSSTPPPPSNQGATPEMDVAWNAVGVNLVATGGTTISTTQATVNLTATSSINVGPTPYWIEIFNVTTGAEIAVCGVGTTCSGTATVPIGPVTWFQAFVADFSTSVPASFQGASPRVPTGGKG